MRVRARWLALGLPRLGTQLPQLRGHKVIDVGTKLHGQHLQRIVAKRISGHRSNMPGLWVRFFNAGRLSPFTNDYNDGPCPRKGWR